MRQQKETKKKKKGPLMKHNAFSFHFYADEDKEESSMGCVGGKEGALYAEVNGQTRRK